jgi:uncharacterized protein involved in exopolysaccharide biosynthesis
VTDTTQLPPATTPDDEIDLLDLVLTIAENIKLLVIGPLLAGLVALGGVWVWPSTFESSFTLNANKLLIVDGVETKLIQPQQISSLVVAKSNLEAAAQALTAANLPNLAQQLIAGAATSTVPRNTAHVLVTVRAPTAQAAHDMAQALLAATLNGSRPQGEELARLTQDLQKDQSALENARTLETRLDQAIKSGKATGEDLTKSYTSLLSAIAEQSRRVEQHRARLAGLGEADVVSKPNLPAAASKPRKTMVVVMAVLVSGFALLFFVFLRKAFQGATYNPESAAKIARIRQLVGLKDRA